MRIGLGVDFHPFKEGRSLYLGGVKIESPQGLDGHSDADVLTHAICDALLGAGGLEDIGKLFPADDEIYRDISSLKLLKETARMVRSRGYRIVNIDAVIVADRPNLGSYYDDMKKAIADTAEIDPQSITIKAKRTEGMGLIGRGEGIAAIANALVD
ncbi:MAG TPA: 2-C-methyl-D-erythritol 2,4-cyclodiphosphate synthase [bacterium (Candidatus Stahlbacteria)]|nr:2-C-methyl-D-erythritol 2,4-cyclodiphosphate synthase [Candidatus Stahlbacteria bacterium]